jgi:hypothetical protein
MKIVMMLKNERPVAPQVCCEEMGKALEHPEHQMYYSAAYEEYGLCLTSGYEYSVIAHCPWCGSRLPNSKRDEWFDELEAQGLDPWGAPVPDEYLGPEWWLKKAGRER